MKLSEHKKHADVPRPDFGFFGRKEWAIVGTTCDKIKALAYELIERLSTDYKVAYVDADHASSDTKEKTGAVLEYTDKINYHRFDTHQKFDTFQYRQWFNEMDIILVNGNHFQAKRQIVVIDPKKEASLEKRLGQLTDVQLILLPEETTEIYSFLQAHLPNIVNIPHFQYTQTEQVFQFLSSALEQTIPPVHGLVLAGGKSQRMGQDKGLLDYHGKPQREHVANLLQPICEKTFISGRADQKIESACPVLADSFLNLGPYGAILSAFRQHPNVAWLVVACDLPLLDTATLQQLLKNRNHSKVATAFQSPTESFPEPLVTIWEPKAYPILLQFLAQGYTCPRKVLINNDIELLQVENAAALTNVNEPSERAEVVKLLSQHHS